MARIGRRGRLWLKGFHELFFILWIGGGASEITIRLLTGSANNGTQLQAFYLAIRESGYIHNSLCSTYLYYRIITHLVRWMGIQTFLCPVFFRNYDYSYGVGHRYSYSP